MYKKIVFILLVLLGGAAFYTYQLGHRSVVVLRVGAQVCEASCFAQSLAEKLQGVDLITARRVSTLKALKQQVVEDFILKSVVIDWAQKNNLFVKEDEITQQIDKVRQQYPDDLQLQQVLAEQGLNLQKWRDKIKHRVLEKKVLTHVHQQWALKQDKLTDKTLKTYYNNNHQQFKLSKQVKLSQIIVPSASQAQHLRQELKKGRNFEQVAEQSGGVKNVGWIELGVFDIFDKAFSRPVGWISEVEQSQHGFHIFKVDGRRSARELSFEAVKPRIKAIYKAREQEKNYKKWLEARLQSVKVYKNEALIDGLQVDSVQRY